MVKGCHAERASSRELAENSLKTRVESMLVAGVGDWEEWATLAQQVKGAMRLRRHSMTG